MTDSRTLNSDKLPVIKSLWIGKLSRVEKICLKSFLYHGHTVELYTYDPLQGIPDGIIIKDANEVLDREKIFKYGEITGEGKGSVAGFANYFRYKMLYDSVNAFWVDMDILCLRPFAFDKELVFGWENKLFISNAVIGTNKLNHELFRELVSYCEDPFKLKRWDGWKLSLRKLAYKFTNNKSLKNIPWGLTGPRALTGYTAKLGLDNFALPKHYFFPFPSNEWKKTFVKPYEKVKPLLSDSYAIHLWHEKMRRDNFDKNAHHQRDSTFEKYAAKYS